ncbi:MAG: Wzz/FepE/Etk N-terminal domain-containing protein [Vicinamibacterales bacterium]
MPHAPVHALDYLSMIRRRAWWFIVPLAAAVVAGVIALQLLPQTFESTATVGVSAPSVSPSLLSQSSVLDNEDRLWALSQQLLSRHVLERVVTDENLWPGRPMADRVSALKSAIELRVPDPLAGTNSRRLDAFVLSYRSDTPERAQRVADRLVNLFVAENARARRVHAENTSAFLASELDEKQARLDEIEGRLRQAKEAYAGSLPGQTDANLQTLTGLRGQLEANAASLRAQQDRLSMVERQISAMEEGSGLDATAAAVPDGSPASRVLELEEQLANARTRYTEKHPEVVRLRQELEAARGEVTPSAGGAAPDRRAQLMRNPSYRQLLADRDQLRLSVRELERAATGTRRQIGDYQARVDAAPMVEQRLASVQREYDRAEAEYDDIAAKLDSARLAESVARDQGGEQFTVLYPASMPAAPVSPVAWRVLLIALVAGVFLGGTAALGREYLDRSVHTTHDLADEFDVPVLGEVTHVSA